MERCREGRFLCSLFARKGTADFIGMQNIRPRFDSPIPSGTTSLVAPPVWGVEVYPKSQTPIKSAGIERVTERRWADLSFLRSLVSAGESEVEIFGRGGERTACGWGD